MPPARGGNPARAAAGLARAGSGAGSFLQRANGMGKVEALVIERAAGGGDLAAAIGVGQQRLGGGAQAGQRRQSDRIRGLPEGFGVMAGMGEDAAAERQRRHGGSAAGADAVAVGLHEQVG